MKKFIPWLIGLLFLVWAVSKMMPPKEAEGLDLRGFGKLPVLVGGRVMPMDTLARVSLSEWNHHGTYTTADGKVVEPSKGFLDVLMMPERSDTAKLFEVSNQDILDLFGSQDAKGQFVSYSFNDLKPFFDEIENQAGSAEQTEAQTRNPFQRGIIRLRDSLRIYLQLKNTVQAEDSPDFGKEILAFSLSIQPGLNAVHDRDAGKPFNQGDFNRILLFAERYKSLMQAKYAYAFPNPQGSLENEGWQHISESLLGAIGSGRLPYAVSAYGRLISAYRAGDVNSFNQEIREYEKYLSKAIPDKLNRPRLEFLFNQAQPFLQAMILYIVALIFGLFSWLVWPKTLGRTAVVLLVSAFLIHTLGLMTRMYLQGRPPVTNLYSSAIFVGWASVLLCIILERFYKNGIGSVCGAVIGFVTLLIAHNLQLDGDTLEMLRAVLDTNGWLATHVVGEAMGYSAMFLAGLIGIIYILRGLLTTSFDEATSKTLGRMMYGVVCFATLFSLVATILGGIWADQSWGRFWGWDPKENGALLIVLWNAVILHARWGGFARERGMALLTVFGNIITSLSWFGVNMLGVGLHSYGFMDRAFGPLIGFIVSQLAIIGLGLIPLKFWRGISARQQPGQIGAEEMSAVSANVSGKA
ncbi:MAG: cytochrome c biogenesis protein CcsA [Verrucomicrobia bacterium]|nr:cytochrome c biogenesis protein CcsA [Verrucomicrobiota bacterium]MBV9129489.1 cytochrome c biogenesis protein CcsA [Verrucomicrobiota bacterium]MBV9642085.1 cytochrome c biogenesis protein CcsA [Verrucomicrobiota bacterium]